MASQEKAEAEKILVVKAAEADAESKEYSGMGVAAREAKGAKVTKAKAKAKDWAKAKIKAKDWAKQHHRRHRRRRLLRRHRRRQRPAQSPTVLEQGPEATTHEAGMGARRQPNRWICFSKFRFATIIISASILIDVPVGHVGHNEAVHTTATS